MILQVVNGAVPAVLLCLLGSLLGRGVYRLFGNAYAGILGYFYDEIVVVNLFYFAVYATGGDKFIVRCEGLAGFGKLFLPFLLRAYHEGVENGKPGHHHDNGHPTS